MAYAGVYKQFGDKKRERALQELLNKADKNGNGRLFVSDFVEVMKANDVTVDDEVRAKIGDLADEAGEISKHDLVIFVKNSALWKDNLEHMHKPGSRTSKVEIMSKKTNRVEAAFKIFDRNRDGYISRDEFAQVSKKLTPKQIDAVFTKFDTSKDGRLSLDEFRKLMERH